MEYKIVGGLSADQGIKKFDEIKQGIEKNSLQDVVLDFGDCDISNTSLSFVNNLVGKLAIYKRKTGKDIHISLMHLDIEIHEMVVKVLSDVNELYN